MSFGSSTSELPLAFSQIRESDSVVRAQSGQVIVIGGLMRETRERNDYKTPGLGSIPVLGNLFKSKRDCQHHRGAGAAAASHRRRRQEHGAHGA